MAALTGNKIKDSYLGLLKTTDSGIFTSSLIRITDGGGNGSQLYLSNTAIRFHNAYTFPNADGTSGQVLSTDGSGTLYFTESSDNQTLEEVLTQGNTTTIAISSSADITTTAQFNGDINGALLQKVKAAEVLSKGDVVYISGGTGDNPEVSKANASDSTKMPALGIMKESLNNINDEGECITSGELTGLNLTGFSTGDELFVSSATAGGLVDTAPTGEANLIQKIGKVIKGGNGGALTVLGAFRVNALPNLPTGVILGNGTSVVSASSNLLIASDGTITLYQPNNVPTDKKNYNIGGGNIALNTDGFNTGFGEGNLSQVGFVGSNNSAFGYQSSFSMTTGDNNTSVGFHSLLSETVGADNTAIGHYSLFNSNNGNYNTAIGSYSLYTNSSGGQNVALGYEALRNNTTSSHNAALGYRALKLSTGDHNLGVGYNSGNAIVTGNNNVVIGSNTGSTIDGLSNRIIISDGAANIRQLIDNVGKLQMPDYGSGTHTGTLAKTLAVDSSGYVIEVDATTGTVTSVALSVPTGLTVTGSPITTSGTIAIGGTLGVANGGTGATTLTGILVGNGISAISAVSDGTVGQVLSTNANGTYSFIDAATGDVTVDGASVGNRVAVWNNTTGELRATSAIATENSNIYLVQPSTNGTDKFNYIIGGAFAINENDFGTQNTGFGHRVFNGADLTGGNNSAFGMESLYSLTTGSHNTSIGSFAMHDNRSGNYNVGLGTKAMFNQRISNYNVAIGYDSMDGVTASQTAVSDYNTAVGYQSLQSIQGGDNNTVIGKDSGNAITTGSNNVIIGSNTGSTITTSSNNIIISDGGGNIRQSFDINGAAIFNGNVGIGVTPSAWQTTLGSNALQFLGGYIYNYRDTNLISGNNAYYDGAWKYYKGGIGATKFNSGNGAFDFAVASSGNANDPITWIDALTISSGGVSTFTNGTSYELLQLKTSRTNANYGIELYHSDSTLYGYLGGTGSSVLSGANTGDLVIRGQGEVILASGGNNRRLTISSGGLATFTPSGEYAALFENTNTTGGQHCYVDIKSNGGTNGRAYLRFMTDVAESGGTSAIVGYQDDLFFQTGVGAAYSTRLTITSGGTTIASRGDAGTLIQASSSSGAGSGIINFYSSMSSTSGNTNCSHFKGITVGVGSWYLHGNGSSTWSSDSRLKKDIETTRDGYIDDIKQLRVVKYKWKNDPNSALELGLIAQEVENIFPSLVVDHKNAIGDEVLYNEEDEIPNGKKIGDVKVEGTTYKGVKYSVLPIILLKAIQEQQTIIEDLKSRIETLEG